jgi:hypothetical protein
MPLKFNDVEKRWLKVLGATNKHISSWESGMCPGRKWLGKISKVKGMSFEDIVHSYGAPEDQENYAS